MVMAPHSDGTLRPTDQSLNQISLEYGYSELCRATKDWNQETNLIGTGSYGSVYRGVLDDGTEVAIKTLDLPDEGGFAEEVRVLSRFRHPNLVILMGLARHNTQRLLVYELLAGGDAHCRLQQSQTNQRPFPWYQRVSVALDAACGLSHLHHATPKVFHRDIKCPNILIDQNGTAKMADFGLACLDTLGDKIGFRVKQASGTVGYACPIYIQTGVITEGSEVYSFGMVLLELLTANPPAVQQEDGTFVYLSHHLRDDVCRVMALVDPKAYWPQEVSSAIAQLAIQCISVKEETRTNFRDIVRNLRTIKNSHPPNIAVPQASTTVSPLTPTRPPVTKSDHSSQRQQKQSRQPQAHPGGQQVSPVRKMEHHTTMPLKLQPRQAFAPLQPFPNSASSSTRRKSPPPARRAHGIIPMQMFNIGPSVMAGAPNANSNVRWERGDAKPTTTNDSSGNGANGGLVRVSSAGRTSGSGSGSGAARPAAVKRPTLFTLELVFCEGADLTTFSPATRCLRHELEEYAASGPFPPFRVGRLFFGQLFEALIPDAGQCSVISREHFQVWIDDSLSNVRGPEGTFFITNFSGNGVKVRDQFVDQRGGQVQVRHGDLISILKKPMAGDTSPLIQFRFDTTGSIITEIPSSLPTGDDEKGAPLYELVFGGPGVAQVKLQDRVVTFRPPMSTSSPFASLVIGRSHQQDLLRRILLEPAYKPIAKTAFEIQAWQTQPLQEANLNAQTSNSTNGQGGYHYIIRGLAMENDEKVGFSGGVRADDVNIIEHNESRKIYHQDRIVLNPNSSEDVRVVITFFDLSENCRKI